MLHLGLFVISMCNHQLPSRLSDGVIVDVGSFDGSNALEYAKTERLVYTIEPAPSKVQSIRQSIKKRKNVKLLNMAFSNKTNGVIDFYVVGNGTMMDQIEKPREDTLYGMRYTRLRVPVSTIDQEIKEDIAFLRFTGPRTGSHPWLQTAH